MSEDEKEKTLLKNAAILYAGQHAVIVDQNIYPYHTDTDELIEAFKAGAKWQEKWQEKNPKWISIDKKLPDIHTVVLGYTDLSDKFEKGDNLIGVYPYNEDGFDTFGSNIKISYWMPLPNSPKIKLNHNNYSTEIHGHKIEISLGSTSSYSPWFLDACAKHKINLIVNDDMHYWMKIDNDIYSINDLTDPYDLIDFFENCANNEKEGNLYRFDPILKGLLDNKFYSYKFEKEENFQKFLDKKINNN